jgi:TonB-dependent starch-binding outer membrane protein SusC
MDYTRSARPGVPPRQQVRILNSRGVCMSSPLVRRVAARVGLLAAVLPALLLAQAGTGTVRGRVTDAASGRALADAQVLVVGTRFGAITNAAGDFTISGVPVGARAVQARRIGYLPNTRTATVAAGEAAVVNFTITASAINLNEVVVTGTAAPVEKRKVGTSIATVDSSTIARAQSVTVDQALQGKLPGAQITQNSGGPGGGGMSVRLRGTNSFVSGSDPLYIVDGMIIDNSSTQLVDLGGRSNPQNRLADLNPADIDRIEVIRGAAAAALYGSRANNGVVQIFTKRGLIGKPRISLTTRYGSNELREHQPFNLYPFDASGLPIARYNYQNNIFRRADTFEQNLALEGGTDATRYFISANNLQDDGIIRSTTSRRQAVRLNLQQQIAPTLLANMSTAFTNTRNEFQAFGEQNDYGIMGSLFFAPTQTDFRPNSAGIYPLPPALGTNPLLAIERIKNPQTVNRFIGSTKFTWTPRSDLIVDYTVGLDNASFEQRQFVPRAAVLGTGLLAQGQALSTQSNTRIINQDLVGSLTTNLTDNVELRTTAGFNFTDQTQSIASALSNNLAPVGEQVNAGAVFSANELRYPKIRTLGLWGQGELSIVDRVFVTGAMRRDCASVFAPAQRCQMFPKVSTSYVVAQDRAGLINNIKLRGAYGEAGSQPGIANAFGQFFNYSNLAFGGRPGFVNDVTFGNPDLRDERSKEFEVGTEAVGFSGRFGFEFNYYTRQVSNLLFFRPLPTSTGFTRQFAPIGEVSNKGIEVLARATPFDRKGFRWDATATYTRNRNLVEKLRLRDPATPGDTVQSFQSAGGYPNRVAEGLPMGVFFGSYAARNCSTGALLVDSLGRYRRSNNTADMGTTLAQRRALGGGTCNDSLNKIIGDPNPDWMGSILNEFTIGGKLRIRSLFDAVVGNDIMNLSTRAQNAGIASNSREFERELVPYGDPNKLAPGFNARTQGIFEYWVEDGSFVKLRELSATYTVDWAPLQRLFKNPVEVSVSGRNLFVWTKYSGYDPEVNLFGTNGGGPGSGQTTAADRGFDFGGYPIPRIWSFSARFTY